MKKFPLCFLFLPFFLLCGCQQLAARRVERDTRLIESGTASEMIGTLKKVRSGPHPELRVLLEKVLADESSHPLARALAAEALGNLGDPRSAQRLVNAVERDTDPTVRVKSLTALAAVKQQGAGDVLRDATLNDPAPLVRITALDVSVSILGRSEAAGILLPALRDNTPAVALTACNHLRNLTGLDFPPDAYFRWREGLDNLAAED